MESPKDLAELFQRENGFLIFTHVQPDGDTLGSALALGLSLRLLGKKAVVVRSDPLPEIYQFLPGSGEIADWRQVEGDFRVGVLVDCGDPTRVGEAAKLLAGVALVVNIDHHGTNAGFGQYNYVDVQAAAVGEQIYELLRSMEVDISPAIATCLYTAIVTDTGSFRYESTRESTFRVAAELVRLGAKPAQVAENAFETRSLSSARLLGRALETLELTPDGKVAWLVISRAAFEETGASDGETEGIINYARAIRGVEVGLLFRETGDGKVRVSLRSRHQVDVSRVASHFDGGGHPRAAGCTLSLPLNEAREKVITAVRGALADS